MYKRVDDSEEIEGFSYENKEFDLAIVSYQDDDLIQIDEGGLTTLVYTEDIPKLIKALQAAYDYKKENKNV